VMAGPGAGSATRSAAATQTVPASSTTAPIAVHALRPAEA
jgi:hypothetical protein